MWNKTHQKYRRRGNLYIYIYRSTFGPLQIENLKQKKNVFFRIYTCDDLFLFCSNNSFHVYIVHIVIVIFFVIDDYV